MNLLLGPVNFVSLRDVDLASVPAEHLASLASCVINDLIINNVSNCDLVSILDSVKCKGLKINRQTLSSEETQALVRAMESRVEVVVLGLGGLVYMAREFKNRPKDMKISVYLIHTRLFVQGTVIDQRIYMVGKMV